MTNNGINARVLAGVRFLDARVPEWREKVNWHRLDIGSYTMCILGQLFGNYDNAICVLGLYVHKNKVDLGFSDNFLGYCTYYVLTRAWQRWARSADLMKEDI